MSAEIIQFVPGLKYEDERAKLDRMIDALETRGQPDAVIQKYRNIRDKLLVLPDGGDCA